MFSVRLGRTSFSLPLMGIGNLSSVDQQGAIHSNSLPLMGIGNQAEDGSAVDTIQDSLPLMEIGNASVRHHIQYRVVLITPHGNWKLVMTQRPSRIQSYSLPLMGIGNSVEPIGRSQ